MRSSCSWKSVFVIVVLLVLAQVVMYGGGAQAQNTPPRFIPVFIRNGDSIPSASEAILAEYSFSDLVRANYIDNLGHNTWQAIKALNPAHQVYLYEYGPATHDVDWDTWAGVERSYVTTDSQDLVSVEYVNTINRWNNARGLSMGNLNTQNPDLFLLDANGNRIDD